VRLSVLGRSRIHQRRCVANRWWLVCRIGLNGFEEKESEVPLKVPTIRNVRVVDLRFPHSRARKH
jgi:hypothetical protein